MGYVHNYVKISSLLRNFSPDFVAYQTDNGASVEYGGELPITLVATLKALGAEVLRYGHRGVVSTVVSF